MFITAMNNGEVRPDPLKGDKVLNINLLPTSKFTIFDPYNQNKIVKLRYNDEIVLV
jgi:hypothetical protein